MNARDTIRIPTRDVVRILALIFGFYIGVRLLWIAHPVIFLFFLGVLFGLPLAQGADFFEKRRVPRGISVAVILTLFLGLLIERFARATDTAGHLKGTGLCLYIVRDRARATGGDVTLAPGAEAGSTFVLLLPRPGADHLTAPRTAVKAPEIS